MNNKQKVLFVLKETKALLSDESRWTKDAFCKDLGTDYTSYDLTGALYAIEKEYYIVSDVYYALMDLLPKDRFNFLSQYNDEPSTTHKDILSLLDRAIKKYEEYQK